MFGYLRFILALMVLLSHVGVEFFTLNPGVIAVVLFYILAGYVTTFIYQEIIPPSPLRILYFYKDRLRRILPLYLVTLIVTLIFILLTSYGSPSLSFIKVLNNLTIIPLNYYMYIDSTILTNPSWNLIPPAWSLATELQAYLLLPFALISYHFRLIALLGSLFVYIVANFSYIHPDYFGYRFIIGVFFIFLIGSFIKSKEYTLVTLLYIVITISISISIYGGFFSATYTKETFIGLLIGIPTIIAISKSKKRIPLNSLFGRLSYGVFLNHFLVIWIVTHFDIGFKNTYLYGFQIIFTTLFISYITLKIENKFIGLKKV
jgi:peptidoglycan/LPS O-acetylase OafA/YrhL